MIKNFDEEHKKHDELLSVFYSNPKNLHAAENLSEFLIMGFGYGFSDGNETRFYAQRALELGSTKAKKWIEYLEDNRCGGNIELP